MKADPDKACPHKTFEASVVVNRLGEDDEDGVIKGYMADLKVNCADCEEPFRFVGMQAGVLHTRPMCSVDETEARLPIRPASSDPDFGMGIPGYAVGFREGNTI